MIYLQSLITILLFLSFQLDAKIEKKVANSAPKIQENEYKKIFKVKTKITNPLDLRDPFKKIVKKRVKKTTKRRSAQKVDITKVPISSLFVVGILSGKTRRALVKIGSGPENLGADSYILKEGMVLGDEEAELKAILPGGIVLVEKIKNIYEQDEYLETIIPLISN